MQYNGKSFVFKERKIVPVEQHVKCKCDCIVKEKVRSQKYLIKRPNSGLFFKRV